jgi:nicotinate-nucleotide adenylyltransferase
LIKTGILGGTFNPPHLGHKVLLETAAKELKLKQTFVIPSGAPPHKGKPHAAFADRLLMCENLFRGNDNVSVLDIENTGRVNYTINTLRELKRQHPDRAFYLIIGTDMLFTFADWYKYTAILKECTLVAVLRHGDMYTDAMEHSRILGSVKVLDVEIPSISSTDIRAKVKLGEDITPLVGDTNAAFIKEKGLFLDE